MQVLQDSKRRVLKFQVGFGSNKNNAQICLLQMKIYYTAIIYQKYK